MTIPTLLFFALGLSTFASAAAAADVILLPPLEMRASQPLAPPSYGYTPLPSYPAAAREQRVEGVVVLSILVGVDGRVVDVSVAASSGSRVLDTAAFSAVTRWTFVPARLGPPAVARAVEVPVK